jgi:tetratricopeptide (TPR) repeat protein
MKKIIIFLGLSVFLLSGCLLKNNSQDVIKITSENTPEKNFIKVNKTLSLSTGKNLLKSGDVDGAIKFFKEYEEFYSKNPEFYYYFGQAYFKKGLYLKASGNFEKALAIDKSLQDLFLNIAEAYEKANMRNKATENYVNYVFKSNDVSKNIEIRNKLNKISEPVVGNDIIGRISLTDRADVIKNSAIGTMQAFNPDTPIIFASIEVINAKKTDKIEVKWDFIGNKEEVLPVNSSEFVVSGAKTVLLSIKSPVAGWPTGNYEMQVFVNGIKNSALKFYVF